jgi:3-oxoadipate CoA-transferase alpha subunit
MGKAVIYNTPAEAVADISDGATIFLGGFTAALGAPYHLFKALLETSDAKDLTFVGNGTPQVSISRERGGFLAMPPERVRKVICSFPVGNRGAGDMSPMGQAFLDGRVELELVPQGTLAERLRAGGAGIPAFFTPTGAGTQFAEGKEVRDFEGRQYVMERWLRADYALIKALKADKLGNLVYRNTARNFNPPMAMAAKTTIVEVDELVEPGDLSPYEIVTPGIFVDRIVVARRDENA